MSLATPAPSAAELADDSLALDAIDTDLVRYMTNVALEMTAHDMEVQAEMLRSFPSDTEKQRRANDVRAAHLLLAASLVRTGCL